MIIGGYALAFLGVPRYTKDLDLWVDQREAPLLLQAIKAFFCGRRPGTLTGRFEHPWGGSAWLRTQPDRSGC
jgi:hypothetical protein